MRLVRRDWLPRALLLASALAPGACGSAFPPPSGPITVTPGSYDSVKATLTDLAAGAAIDLIYPPQGGFVVFVGARVRNLTDGVVELRGRLLDATGALTAEDARTVAMRRDASDPFLWLPDLTSYTNVSNIPVCPSQSATDRFNVPFTLEVAVSEPSTGRSASGTVAVTTACRQLDPTQLALCRCECAGGFFLGKCQ
jgi:hypothetical protein